MENRSALAPLDQRPGLPDALRVLLEEYPRAGWTADPGFNGLIQFWLERHLMFRRLLEMLGAETEAQLDAPKDAPGGADGPARTYRGRLARYGGMFVNELHTHHMIEDDHYFPALTTKDARLSHGFALLDADHHALDGVLSRFADSANNVLQTDPAKLSGAAARLLTEIRSAERLLNRHLTDEEELIVPIILKHGTDGLPG